MATSFEHISSDVEALTTPDRMGEDIDRVLTAPQTFQDMRMLSCFESLLVATRSV